jgi:very-short-patch-repair endonuclease
MSDLEDLLALHIRAAGLPEPEREVIYLPGRRFRADFCWRPYKLVAEVQGGTYAHMAHSTGAGIDRDYTKANLSMLAGWRYLQFSRRMIEDGTAIEYLSTILNAKEED